jgi:DNA polymerase
VSRAAPLPAGLRARLEWLRLLGVEDLRVRRPAPVAGPAVVAAAQPAAPAQPALFAGVAPETESADGDAVPSLAATRAPEAPDPASALAMIRDALGDCRRCRLCEGRTNIVFGVGDPGARLMFVGEGPGADEDARGEPFVGRAGQLLTRIIESMGLARGEVYIANVVKCRPPENRTPRPDEIATCSPFLFQQIRSIKPRVLVCLGTPATQTVLGTRATITHLRGRFREIDGIRIMPTYHPAYLLRNPAAKKEVWEDMKQVIAFLKSEESPRSAPARE